MSPVIITYGFLLAASKSELGRYRFYRFFTVDSVAVYVNAAVLISAFISLCAEFIIEH